ncbi:unnamed protein product [Anisakis simplex]|uniref:PAS domain-containing protein n=1 Tax=Anisakis simplex TaxID=6269 RepID=A0A0M3K9Z0_ANISI|nr:unnamed protein product [Anisakis simplex]
MRETAKRLGEEYWAIIDKNGKIHGNRTVDDFLEFDATHNGQRAQNAYIAFFVDYDQQDGFYEAFGQAYTDFGKVCARFVDRHGKNIKLCGGFRVLSRRLGADDDETRFRFIRFENADIHRAVEYRFKQAAMISSWGYEEGHYGSADMRRKTAEAIDYEGNVIKVSHAMDPIFFNKRVFVLTLLSPDTFYSQQYEAAPPRAHRTHRPIYHTPEQSDRNPQQRSYVYSHRLPEQHFHRQSAWKFFDPL